MIEECRNEAPKPVEFSQRMKETVAEEMDSMIFTTFSLNEPTAQSVYLAGSFNEWSLSESCRMQRDDSGNWSLRLPLESGTYQYQFIVDGRWQPDPENSRNEPNGFGDMNSVIEVGANG